MVIHGHTQWRSSGHPGNGPAHDLQRHSLQPHRERTIRRELEQLGYARTDATAGSNSRGTIRTGRLGGSKCRTLSLMWLCLDCRPPKVKDPTLSHRTREGWGTLGVPHPRRRKTRHPQRMHVTMIAKKSSIKESCFGGMCGAMGFWELS